MKKYVCTDIGGTAIKHGLITGERQLLSRRERNTESYKGGPSILKKAEEIAEEYCSAEEISGICISTAGMADTRKGEIFYASPLIPGYTGICFKKTLEEKFQVPCEAENNVNSAGLAEYVSGAASVLTKKVAEWKNEQASAVSMDKERWNMEYYVKSVVPIIESNYDNLTVVEKNIADFFIKNQKKVDFSAKAIAERLYVSEASLSRFAKKCGYRGYREFMYQYEETFIEKEESMAGSTRMILNAYQELLNKTYSLINEAQIARINRYLSQADRVFVCGKGSSGFAAEEMEHRFMRIGVDIDSIQDSDLMRMQAVFQDKRSLVFGISVSGETEPVLYLLREASKRGAKTVLLTAKNRGIFEQFCDDVVLFPSLGHLNYGNVISPQFPILVMLDVIYSSYVEQDRFAREILHDNTLRALGKGRKFE